MNNKKDRYLFSISSIITCLILLLVSIAAMPKIYTPDAAGYLLRLSYPIGMCIVFYANYYWLAPSYYSKKKFGIFIAYNLLGIAILSTAIHYCMVYLFYHESPPGIAALQTFDEHVKYILRIMPILLLSTGVSTLVFMSIRWNHLELERKQAELARQEAEIKSMDAEMGKVSAELKMLQAQVSPHMMLNTLNNIYALIMFDKEKAQQAVISLSKILGYCLYTREEKTINLKEDMELMQHYIDLMKIRLSDNVTVNVDIQLPEPCNIRIAPFMFVQLIENAFKYGTSSTAASFINIIVHADEQKISFSVSNSYHPNGIEQQSSHGVGLEQVAKRLEMIYPGKYRWEKGVDKKKEIYTSNIIIYDTDMCHY